MMKENVTASIIGLRHGSVVSQPNTPLPPRSRPAISTEATMVNTVSSVGTDTSAVMAACTNLNPRDLRIGKQVMDTDGHGENQEQRKGYPPHRVAVEPPARDARGTML